MQSVNQEVANLMNSKKSEKKERAISKVSCVCFTGVSAIQTVFSCSHTCIPRKMIRYVYQHGVWATSAYILRKLGRNVSISSIHSIQLVYLKCMRGKRRADQSDGMIAELPARKQSQPLLLCKHMEEQLQLYLKKTRDQRGVVSASVVVAAARGILFSIDRTQLVEFRRLCSPTCKETVGLPFTGSNEPCEKKS